jgi:hypothetical protein
MGALAPKLECSVKFRQAPMGQLSWSEGFLNVRLVIGCQTFFSLFKWLAKNKIIN